MQYPASIAFRCLLEWRRDKEGLPESRKAFKVAAAQTSELFNLVSSRQSGLFECEYPLIDKPMLIDEPAESHDY